jgi:hypothetical protein
VLYLGRFNPPFLFEFSLSLFIHSKLTLLDVSELFPLEFIMLMMSATFPYLYPLRFSFIYSKEDGLIMGVIPTDPGFGVLL